MDTSHSRWLGFTDQPSSNIAKERTGNVVYMPLTAVLVEAEEPEEDLVIVAEEADEADVDGPAEEEGAVEPMLWN